MARSTFRLEMAATRMPGVLWVRPDVPLAPIILGGGQEGGYRSGTENVPAIVGIGDRFDVEDQVFGARRTGHAGNARPTV